MTSPRTEKIAVRTANPLVGIGAPETAVLMPIAWPPAATAAVATDAATVPAAPARSIEPRPGAAAVVSSAWVVAVSVAVVVVDTGTSGGCGDRLGCRSLTQATNGVDPFSTRLRKFFRESSPAPSGAARPGELALAAGEDQGAVLGDGDGVLGVGGARAVGRADGPAVRVVGDLVGGAGEPGFEGQGEPRPQAQPPSGPSGVGDVGVLVHRAPEPVATELEVDRIAVPGGDRADGGGDVAEAPTGLRGGDRGLEGLLAGADQLPVLLPGRADDDGAGGVGDPAVDGDGEVHRQDVAVAQHVVVRQAVQDGVVDRQADDVAEGPAAEGGGVVPVARLGAALPDELTGVELEVEEVDPDGRPLPHGLQDVGDEASGRVHPFDLGRGLQLDHRRTSPVG